MGNVSDGEILASIREHEQREMKKRDDELEAAGFVRVTTASSRWTPDKISGWKLHVVAGHPIESCESLGRKTALCGLSPAHGWGVDMFIDAECERCGKAFARLSTPDALKGNAKP